MSIELGVVCIGAAIAISISFAFAAWFERSKTKKEWVDDGLKTVFSCFFSPVTLCFTRDFYFREIFSLRSSLGQVLSSSFTSTHPCKLDGDVGLICSEREMTKKKPALMPAEWWGYPQPSRRVQFLQGFSTKADRLQYLKFSTSLWRVARVMAFGLLRSEWC